MRGLRDTRYEKGYRPKIEFWAEELLKAARDEGSGYSLEYMAGKINYFVTRETERQEQLRNEAH